MKTYARMQAGQVVELVQLPQEISVAELFSNELIFVDVTSHSQTPKLGDVYDGTSFARPAPIERSLPEIAADLTLRATAIRWDIEIGGITLPSGVRIETAKADQDRITAVLVNADHANIDSIDFKAASGWTTLSIAELRGIAIVIAMHVQACFTAERQHHDAIRALSTADAANAYDLSVGWPHPDAVHPFA